MNQHHMLQVLTSDVSINPLNELTFNVWMKRRDIGERYDVIIVVLPDTIFLYLKISHHFFRIIPKSYPAIYFTPPLSS